MDTHQQNQAHADEMSARASLWSALATLVFVATVFLGTYAAVGILVFLLQAFQ